MNVSIIICTRNRADSLAKTLDAMDQIAVPSGLRPEILIVDNGSTDETPDIVRRQSGKRIAIRYISEPIPGLSHARNTGMAASSSEIILFTDDDVAPAPDWLEVMANPLLQRKSDGVVGNVDLARTLWRPWMTEEHKAGLTDFHGEPFQLIGANMGFHRSVLEQVPGFDTELGAGALGFAEETLFSWQLSEAGFRLQYLPEASVVHYPDASRLIRSSWLSHGRKHGASMAYLLHHWFHEIMPSPRLRYYYVALKLRLRRLIDPPPSLDAEGVALWELSYVSQMQQFRQFLIECRRPRNYSKRGPRKRGVNRQESLQIDKKRLNPLQII